MRKVLLLVFGVLSLRASACPAESRCDTLPMPAAAEVPFAPKTVVRPAARSCRMACVALPLIAGGVAMQSSDVGFRRLRNGYAGSFHHDFDDYLQYMPAVAMVGLKACGVESRSSWGRMLVSDAFSAGVMAIAVNSLKYSCRVMRPDGSTRNSFPSGHTATAFMMATMLHKEYGHRSPWYSIGGYTLATATGVGRMLNNRHWMSDVMVGAGIGILAAELGYYLADLIFKDRGLNVERTVELQDRWRRPSFLSFDIGMTVVPGRYAMDSGARARFASGPTLGVGGAWFASPCWGVGGKMKVSNLRVSVDGISQSDNFESASVLAGPGFSWPVSARWLISGNAAGGWAFYKSCNTDFGRLGGRDGFSFGGGVSTTCLVRQHLGFRVSADYDCAPGVVAGMRDRFHTLTLGMNICAVF